MATHEKKSYRYRERDEAERQKYREQLATIAPEQLLYLDEAGIDDNESYPWAWAAKGERAEDEKPGRRSQRYSIISALQGKELVAPLVFEGYTNTKVFVAYLEQWLLPELKPGQVLVMDNASFHKGPLVREVVEAAGCRILYLPPYSPDLNPIEHQWFRVKNAVRKELPDCEYDLDAAMTQAFRNLSTT